MDAVTINLEVEKLSIKSPEFLLMEKENDNLKSEINDIKKTMEDLKDMKDYLDGIKAKAGK